jgi:ATP-dependent protease ClpP protease subunit
MQNIQVKLQQGVEKFVLLISSPGGSVAAGLSLYNFLKGIPAEIETHNFGSVDSVAIVVFCAGQKRYCVPNARFLLHGIGFDIPVGTRFEEKHLEEKIKDLKMDKANIVKVIAENCKKTEEEISNDIHEVKVLNPEDAKGYGLVHEIKKDLFPVNAEVINISGPWQ